jgi:hypothetical protein
MPPDAIASNCVADRVMSAPKKIIKTDAERLMSNGRRRVAKSITVCTAMVALHIPNTIEVATGGF